jgi:hypothetical protein
MFRHLRFDKLLLSLVMISAFVAACSSPSSSLEVSEIQPQLSEMQVGESEIFTVLVSGGAEIEFEWHAVNGTVQPEKATAKYTAPDTPGKDTVHVYVTSEGKTVDRTLSFNVVAPPTPTDTFTPTPTYTQAPTDTPSPTATHTPSPTSSHTPSPTPTHTPSPTSTITQTPTDTPSPTLTHTPRTPTRTPTPTFTPPPPLCEGDTSQKLIEQMFLAIDHKNYEKALVCTFELERKWDSEAKQQQAQKQASDCRYTPNPADQAAVDSFWRTYWALNDVATGLFERGEIYRTQGKCQQAKALYQRVLDEYSCAFAWNPDNGGFFWSVADGAAQAKTGPCP